MPLNTLMIDLRYQKMLKSMVNKAKERIQDQIEAAKKGKKFSEPKYSERMGRESLGFYDEDEWEDGDEERKITGGRRIKKVQMDLMATVSSWIYIYDFSVFLVKLCNFALFLAVFRKKPELASSKMRLQH